MRWTHLLDLLGREGPWPPAARQNAPAGWVARRLAPTAPRPDSSSAGAKQSRPAAGPASPPAAGSASSVAPRSVPGLQRRPQPFGPRVAPIGQRDLAGLSREAGEGLGAMGIAELDPRQPSWPRSRLRWTRQSVPRLPGLTERGRIDDPQPHCGDGGGGPGGGSGAAPRPGCPARGRCGAAFGVRRSWRAGPGHAAHTRSRPSSGANHRSCRPG